MLELLLHDMRQCWIGRPDASCDSHESAELGQVAHLAGMVVPYRILFSLQLVPWVALSTGFHHPSEIRRAPPVDTEHHRFGPWSPTLRIFDGCSTPPCLQTSRLTVIIPSTPGSSSHERAVVREA